MMSLNESPFSLRRKISKKKNNKIKNAFNVSILDPHLLRYKSKKE